MREALTPPPVLSWADMGFPQRLVALRKERGLTQQALADRIGVHVTLFRRYEAGKTQPSLDTLRRIALALNVSADVLLFDPEERDPGDDLRLQFEAVSHLDPDEQRLVRELINGILLQHEAKRWTRTA